ncbi:MULTISPECIES: HipA N-terminal domain-containing protein [Flavobacterium]|uniref:Phosphatidylinositol kinase n=1 Tax=Flavobacterium gawalongense TaxID=2594432 RepID=A0A553BYY5_9FLAO|nr:HipA N-terminal domain-containing protein [Flavobacterium gawalongense]TRX13435.1 phosphatidylinositol kinase [Flavobacterium gawalongense]TRX15634.1 phosphatidylinositol kinase [Flavobacterium gawalongense]TRX31472.1 phosphatidylinositol kinase [Flavobacterium gawalongense]
MRKAKIVYKDEEAGVLTQHDNGSFIFRYHDSWMADSNKPGISLTLPKREQEFHSKFLFPFFYNMLPEGSNKQMVCKYNRIDLDDYFGLLMTTAKYDSIGAVRVIKIEEL